MKDSNKQEFVTEKKVACQGSEKTELGHPIVYLKMAKNQNQVVCPYCSKKFILKLKKGK